MIKFDFIASDDLIDKFKASVVSDTQRRMREYLLTIPPQHRSAFERFFDDAMIEQLLTCRAEDLVGHISAVYDAFPILADRYWPARLLTRSPIPVGVESYGATTQHQKAELDNCWRAATDFLMGVATPEKVFLSNLLDKMLAAESYPEKRTALAAINTAARGSGRATKDFLSIFPAWINSFESVFNYQALSAAIGHDIVDGWSIDVCLYCNSEPIQTQGRRVRFRTDLDHFYPRTKFPFLAVTLSNLIPSGKVCNQSYKQNKDMMDYEHPFVGGVGLSRVFHLSYPFGVHVSRDNFAVNVLRQGGKLDANLAGFEIGENYANSNELKDWVANAFETVELVRGLNDPVVGNKLLRGLVNFDKPAHNERHKKFKLDSINQFADRDLLLYF